MKAIKVEYVEVEYGNGQKEAFPLEVAKDLLNVLEAAVEKFEPGKVELKGAVTVMRSQHLEITVFGERRTVNIELAKKLTEALKHAIT